MVGDVIYFADDGGVHKTDSTFENIQTLINGENDSDSLILDSPKFANLQYYNGKIYFLNKGSFVYIFYGS